MAHLLLEIGLEEVPAGFMEGALQQLNDKAAAMLAEARLSHGQIDTMGTPRRLILSVQDLAEGQDDLEETVKGPAAKIAYDADGQPSKALLGFCRGHGVAVDEVYQEAIKGDPYIFALKKIPGQASRLLLQDLLPNLIGSLDFPKTMRWGSYDMRFVRPIHWIVALLDDDVIPFQIEVAQSGRHSYGHRALAPDRLEISGAETYRTQMQGAWVMVNPQNRRDKILAEMDDLSQTHGLTVDKDPKLLEEVIHLLEYPTVFLGHINPVYLDLPQDLVVTPMKDHQRYFPVFDKEGQLAPRFIGVRNGNAQNLAQVQVGNENVLEARLQDALFFYEEDLKADLDQWREGLKDVVFQEKLGSIYDKSQRNRALTGQYADLFGFSAQVKEGAQLAADYAKVDLVSLVVDEFPELQGIMGEIYIMASGKAPAPVGQAIREHYLPRFHGDALPTSQEGLLLSLADKMDTIVGCFAAGIEPTGSQDPYALRRQGAGIIAMIIDHGIDCSLKEMISLACAGLPDPSDLQLEGLETKVYAFFSQRLRTYLEDLSYPTTFVRALLEAGYDRVTERVRFSQEARAWVDTDPEAFDRMKALYKRVYNLIEKDRDPDHVFGDTKPELFQENAEKALYEGVVEVGDARKDRSYQDHLNAFLSLTPKIESFFEEVMVMAEDPDLRQNRLNLLHDYMTLVSDLIRIEAL